MCSMEFPKLTDRYAFLQAEVEHPVGQLLTRAFNSVSDGFSIIFDSDLIREAKRLDVKDSPKFIKPPVSHHHGSTYSLSLFQTPRFPGLFDLFEIEPDQGDIPAAAILFSWFSGQTKGKMQNLSGPLRLFQHRQGHQKHLLLTSLSPAWPRGLP